ncbi:hypothetical protein BJ138DRAFT_1215655, partial [Hygrophoropsis aurantiaca]
SVPGWDGWPDGDFEQFFTYTEARERVNLFEHWACQPLGGDKRGNDQAKDWEDGKKTGRRCMGIIKCDDPSCRIIVRPQTRMKGIEKQLSKRCECGGILSHDECDVMSFLYSFHAGIRYIHKGMHRHAQPTHLLHLTPKERARFEKIVYENPMAGPLALIVGPQGRDGPQEGVGSISPVLLNVHRVKSDIQRLRKKAGKDEWHATFNEFTKQNSNFILYHQFGDLSAVVMQTPFMASTLVKDHISRDAVNGVVTDAAHGFWKEHNDLLIISSTYNPSLSCWVPALMTYANGASSQHNHIHFFHLFESMAKECDKRGEEVTDELFANVVDFSEAERAGYIDAFVNFWTARGDQRTDNELRAAAAALLKGCQQHFRSQVTRVSKISGVIPPDQKEHFQDRAKSLLTAANLDAFHKIADALLRDYPNVENWLRWWMRDTHASMLFEPFRSMPDHIWESIPNTTNAEEAMHRKLYVAAGKYHTLLEGLVYLKGFAQYFETQAAAQACGIKTRYGMPEPWKAVRDRIGRTKSHRAPEGRINMTRNDGRPPDTSHQLLRKKNLTAGDLAVSSDVTRAGYPWKNNSCWLDTSLELIYVTVAPNFLIDFSPRFHDVAHKHPLSDLHQVLDLRVNLVNDSSISNILEIQRDSLRKNFHSAHIIPSIRDVDSLTGWISRLLIHQVDSDTVASTLSRSYFEGHTVNFRSCTGSTTTPKHWQVSSRPTRSCDYGFQLDAVLSEKHNNSLQTWLTDYVRINRSPTKSAQCWRTVEGRPLCNGSADVIRFLVHLPVMLIIDLGDYANPRNIWDITNHLRPLSRRTDEGQGLIYDIVGLALFNGTEGSHFIARYTPDGKKVFDYDGMQNGGIASLVKGSISSHLTGLSNNIPLPDGYHIHAVIYRLRGGAKAQGIFARHQTEQAERLFSVHFDFGKDSLEHDEFNGVLPSITLARPNLRQLQPEDLKWMNNPTRTKTVDYEEVELPGSQHASTPKMPRRTRGTKRKHTQVIVSEDEIDTGNPMAITESRIDDQPSAPPSNSLFHAHSPSSSLEDEVHEPILPPSSQQSAYPIQCRCGLEGDGHDIQPDEIMLMCDDCQNWSHMACQKNGRASKLTPKQRFICDFCAPPLLSRTTTDVPKRRSGRSKTWDADVPSKIPLEKRLLAGKGALARHGKYYYPVRLIQRQLLTDASGRPLPGTWKVAWWYGCKFGNSGKPGDIVDEKDLVDELWHDSKRRREIRLGEWVHACQVPAEEDVIMGYLEINYSEAIDQILRPQTDTLQKLLNFPDPMHYCDLPVGQYLISKNQSPLTTGGYGIKFSGDLNPLEYAGIANWFHHHIPGAKNAPHAWLGCAPLAHAFTLIVAHQKQHVFQCLPDFPSSASVNEQSAFILNSAWKSLQQKTKHQGIYVDVDKECLWALERRMFEDSMDAGRAGNQQWGLDMGEHQHGWNPYEGLPTEWNFGDREFSETELEVCCNSLYFVENNIDKNMMLISMIT